MPLPCLMGRNQSAFTQFERRSPGCMRSGCLCWFFFFLSEWLWFSSNAHHILMPNWKASHKFHLCSSAFFGVDIVTWVNWMRWQKCGKLNPIITAEFPLEFQSKVLIQSVSNIHITADAFILVISKTTKTNDSFGSTESLDVKNTLTVHTYTHHNLLFIVSLILFDFSPFVCFAAFHSFSIRLTFMFWNGWRRFLCCSLLWPTFNFMIDCSMAFSSKAVLTSFMLVSCEDTKLKKKKRNNNTQSNQSKENSINDHSKPTDDSCARNAFSNY